MLSVEGSCLACSINSDKEIQMCIGIKKDVLPKAEQGIQKQENLCKEKWAELLSNINPPIWQ